MRKKRDLTVKEDRRLTYVSVLVTFAAAGVTFALGLPDRWLAAIFCTVGVFTGLIAYFRRQWRLREFWLVIAGALILHTILFYWLFQHVLTSVSNIPLIFCVPVVFVEAGIIYYAIRFVEARLATNHPIRRATHKP